MPASQRTISVLRCPVDDRLIPSTHQEKLHPVDTVGIKKLVTAVDTVGIKKLVTAKRVDTVGIKP